MALSAFDRVSEFTAIAAEKVQHGAQAFLLSAMVASASLSGGIHKAEATDAQAATTSVVTPKLIEQISNALPKDRTVMSPEESMRHSAYQIVMEVHPDADPRLIGGMVAAAGSARSRGVITHVYFVKNGLDKSQFRIIGAQQYYNDQTVFDLKDHFGDLDDQIILGNTVEHLFKRDILPRIKRAYEAQQVSSAPTVD